MIKEQDSLGRIKLHAKVAILGEVVGRSFAAPMLYDLRLPDGRVVSGVPHEAIAYLRPAGEDIESPAEDPEPKENNVAPKNNVLKFP